MPKGPGLCHVDLSNNTISVIEAPRSERAFRRLKSLKIASNQLGDVEEDAALALTSLERLDVSGEFQRMRLRAADAKGQPRSAAE